MSDSHSIVVLERSPLVAQRIARVLAAACGLGEVFTSESVAELRGHVSERTAVVALEASNIDVALEWVRGPFPQLKILTWSQEPLQAALQIARHEVALQSLVGWPSHQSLPRAWELTAATRYACSGPGKVGPTMAELLAWGASVIEWRPRTSGERDHAVAEVERLAALAGASSRLVERLAVCAHELLMNAMYDAPVDDHGRALYAQDRKQDIVLDDRETPVLRLGVDGLTVGLEIVDPFGRLKRKHVLASILRGLEGAADASADVLDTTNGGAGLGFFRLYQASTALFVEVAPRRSTRVTVLLDMDVSAREARSQPSSLHLFFDADGVTP